MRVETAIDLLSKMYNPSDELFIVWWSKEEGETYANEDLSDTHWKRVVEELDQDEYLFHAVNDTITELVNKPEEEV